jgi:predicted nucleic acid-binding protein
MKPLVYIETTIPSFYYEIRTEPEIAARKEWTRQWWDKSRHHYQLVTSEAVLDEIEKGNFQHKENVLALASKLRIVPVEHSIVEIVETYIQHNIMPKNPVGDALHLALASYHKCDFLLTWNCKHLANANKFNHIRRINTMLGLYVPILATPLELLGGIENAER